MATDVGSGITEVGKIHSDLEQQPELLRKLRNYHEMVVFFRHLIEAQQTPEGFRESIYDVFLFIFFFLWAKNNYSYLFLSLMIVYNLCQYFRKLRTFSRNDIFC